MELFKQQKRGRGDNKIEVLGRDQILQGLITQFKEFGFYSDCHKKTLEGFEQKVT